MVYIVADPKFFSIDDNFDTPEKRNKSIIDNWTSVITNDEYVLLMGDISHGSFEETKELFSQLTGTIKLITFKENESKFTREEYFNLGISGIYCINGYVRGEIEGTEQRIVILSNKDNYKALVSQGYVAAPRSLVDIGKTSFKNRTLSISIDEWGYSPIEYNYIPTMINFMITYEKMEEE
jgi:calcineurin-like phosphoesterase family protein